MAIALIFHILNTVIRDSNLQVPELLNLWQQKNDPFLVQPTLQVKTQKTTHKLTNWWTKQFFKHNTSQKNPLFFYFYYCHIYHIQNQAATKIHTELAFPQFKNHRVQLVQILHILTDTAQTWRSFMGSIHEISRPHKLILPTKRIRITIQNLNPTTTIIQPTCPRP